jgi:diguanylate cyclase (GGDEF)-like protein
MSEQLQTCLSREEAYPIINYFVQKLFPAKAGAIFILDRQDNFFKTATSWRTTLLGEKQFKPEDCLSLQKRKLHISLDSQQESCCRHLCLAEGRSSICIPMLAQGDVFGILHLQKRTSAKLSRSKPSLDDTSADISIDIQQLAVTMADFFSLALVNIQLRETLKHQATRDPLTGLFNRRYMEETLIREISRANRQGTPLGIIMLDLDHFRRFNNVFGHEAGDLALQEVGQFLQKNIRKEDIACRYGGEEFTLILPGASLEASKQRAEILRHNVQNLKINYKDKKLDNISFSLGVAIYPDHGQTQDDVIQAADEALYRAKHAGRKQVKLAINTKQTPGKDKSLRPEN